MSKPTIIDAEYEREKKYAMVRAQAARVNEAANQEKMMKMQDGV